MIIAAIPPLFAIVGMLVYALSGNTKVSEMGRIAFAFGLLVTLLMLEHTGGVRIL